MLGRIESYDAETESGIIVKGNFKFEFFREDWLAQVEPEAGDEVRFQAKKNVAVEVDLIGASLASEAVKYKYVAVVLAAILGGLGAHRFYLGYYKIGLAQIAITALTLGYGVMWGVIETVLLLGGHINRDAKGRPLK
ncbi:MAG: hypothetical protein CTY34_02340 [Methylobacter sp.]|nr:MAG: hypothetical protein CTY34_02340 [Methylobacter sp.]PPD04913.1 MAG: hypothetical protein CTY29_03540 [Methylobacter sp.]PPD32536.1 MAG: hypothetical protein CTY18_10510 [Methylomonas sp.]